MKIFNFFFIFVEIINFILNFEEIQTRNNKNKNKNSKIYAT